MNTISRRRFLQTTAFGAAAAFAARAAQANPLGMPIGCQVWPIRAQLKDFPALAKNIAALGVTQLELCSPIGYGSDFASLTDPKEVKKIMTDHGLSCESSHFTMRELRKEQDKSLAWAHEIGITQVISATLGDGNGGSHPTLDQVKKAAEEYNQIAERTAKAGMQQGLHNEGFEMAEVDGQKSYDLLFTLLDPALVKFQFQMSTITAGFVAAEYFHKYPGRFYSMHLQDIDMNAPAPPRKEGKEAQRPQVAVGKGSIDWVKTFAAAKEGGVKNYFVEQSWDLMVQSVEYLKALKA